MVHVIENENESNQLKSLHLLPETLNLMSSIIPPLREPILTFN